MSDIKFYCTSCGKKMGIDSRASGLSVSCPKCGTRVHVPETSQESAPVSPLLKPTPKPPPIGAPPRPRPMISRPREEKAPVPPAPRPPPVVAPAPKPGVDAAEVSKLKKKVETLEEQNQSVLSELAKSKDALAAIQLEKEALQKTLSEQERTAASSKEGAEKRTAELLAETSSLKAGKAALEKEVETLKAGQSAFAEREKELDKLRVDKDAANARIKALEELNAKLNRDLDTQKEAAEKAVGSSDDVAAKLKELETKNESLTKDIAAGAALVEKLEAEREELLVHRSDAKALSNAMTDLQDELKSLREQESKLKQTVEEAEDKISKSSAVKTVAGPAPGSWPIGVPAQKPRKWLAALAGIAFGAVLCAAFFLLLWPKVQGQLGEQDTVVPVEKPPVTRQEGPKKLDVELGERFEIDGVEVVVTRARIAPVEMVLLLGYEETTDESYFILDVEMMNRNREHDLILRNPWKDTKLVDDMGRLLRSAFTQPMQFQEVRGVTLNETLALNEKIESIMVFEWDDLNSDSFTLTVDPGFKKPARDGMLAQISYETFTLKIPREKLEEQQD